MQRLRRVVLPVGSWLAFAILAIAIYGSHDKRSSAIAEDNNTKQQRTVATLMDLEGAFSSIAKQIRPAVVSVLVEKRVATPAMQMTPFDDPFFRQFFGAPGPRRPAPESMRQQGAGSGVIVDSKGFILTNNHVVEGADKITVALSDPGHTKLQATVVGTDPRTDLAVLKINAHKGLVAATLGDSDKVQPGQWAIAVGNQLGEFDSTLTVGVVSATGRRLDDMGEADYNNLIQTDAAINPGNSGGPLLNVHGEVIGINSAIASPNGGSVGLGFAIPINAARRVEQQLIAHGHVDRGYLGVHIGSLNDALKQYYGVTEGALVQDVEKGGPADKAGVRAEDVVVSLDGKKVEDADSLRSSIAALDPHSTAQLGIVRDGKTLTLSVALGALPAQSAQSHGPAAQSQGREEHPRLGMSVTGLTNDVRAQLNLPESVQGVAITDVVDGSPASRAGLQPGDVIERVNRAPVASLADLNRAVNGLGKHASIALKIRRGEDVRIVGLTLGEE